MGHEELSLEAKHRCWTSLVTSNSTGGSTTFKVLIITTTIIITVKMNHLKVKRKEDARCCMKVTYLQRVCDVLSEGVN